MKIPTNTKNTYNPYKQDVFETYVCWKSIPAFMKKADPVKMADKMGIEETEIIELMGIHTQTEFAQKYDVEPSTLSNWNKLIEKREMIKDIRKWAGTLTKNVLWALYKNAINKGNPENFKLWLEVVHGWSEKGNIAKTKGESLVISFVDMEGNSISKFTN